MKILSFTISISNVDALHGAMRTALILSVLSYCTGACLIAGLITWLSASDPTNGFRKPDVKELTLRSKIVEEKLCSWCRETCVRPNHCCPAEPEMCYAIDLRFINQYGVYICSYKGEEAMDPENDDSNVYDDIVDSFNVNETYTIVVNNNKCGLDAELYVRLWIAGMVLICLCFLCAILFIVSTILWCFRGKIV